MVSGLYTQLLLLFLIEATDSWAFNINYGYINAVVFLDLKEGFSTVDHEILLTKMNRCGIQEKLLIGLNHIWCITHNSAQLTIVSLTSPILNVVCHREQYGPLLLLIYINHLPSFSVLRMYADDTHITYAGSDLHLIQSSLSHNLEKLSKWLVSNRLTLNATKTEFMLICAKHRSSTLSDTLKLSIDNVPIEQVSSVKSLRI